MQMATEKPMLKNAKKKKKQENPLLVDQEIYKSLQATHIVLLTKPSTKFPKAKFVCKICPYHMDDIDRAVRHSRDSSHQKTLKKLMTRNLLLYLPKPSKIQLESVNECLVNKLKEQLFITNEEYQRRLEVVMKMNEVADSVNPGSRLVLSGSLLTGLSLVNTSDVNMYLDMPSKDSKNTGYLNQFQKLSTEFKTKLSLKTEIKFDKNISGLLCKDKQNVHYHISVSNRMQQLTSELIRLYLKIDSRAEDLAKLFRYFAKKSFIDQVKDGFFPSEAFPILVIFYLQQLQTPILPNLHKLADLKTPEQPDATITRETINDTETSYVNDISWIRKLWNPPMNEMSLSELWIGLLRFYVVDFNSSSYVVSIRSIDVVQKSDRNMINKRLAIEDPFDVKRNLLFRWNTPDIIEYLNEQLQGCYKYFAVPQLANGPLFEKVNFMEITLSNMKPTLNVTAIFSKDNFEETISIIEGEFKKLYTELKSYYDVTKWPVEIFVRMCLGKILTSVFNSPVDIKNLISLLELKVKQTSFFSIEAYVKFREYAQRLLKCVLQEFSDYFEQTKTWGKLEMDTMKAFNLVKKSSQSFINESLNITHNEDDDDEFDELHDSDLNELDDTITDKEFALDEVEELDTLDGNTDEIPVKDAVIKENVCSTLQETEAWKLPIVFKKIYYNIRGCLLSSDKQYEYNENQIINLKKEDLVYSFDRACVHTKKLVITCTLCNTKDHRKENCPHAVPRFDDLSNVMETVDQAWLVKLKFILTEKFKSTIPNNDKIKDNERIFEQISDLCKTLYPSARPQKFGSTLNGFSTKVSDLDICLEFYDNNQRVVLSVKEITNRLKNIGREIKKHGLVTRIDYILKAKVPIIKFYTKTHMQGDISINNSLGLQNTAMLKLYVEINPSVKLLGNMIKYVAKACEIGDASQGTLSSYAYMLMLIHFLQKRKVLPVLQELYEGDRPVKMIDGWDAWYQSDMSIIYKLWNKKDCPDTTVEYLWLDFFYYYAVEFDVDKEVVTIRQSQPLFKIDKNWQSAFMAVEDPFNLSHNLCGSLSLENCRYILECFAHVLEMHSNPKNLQRPDTCHYLLLEPSTLRPIGQTGRSCFNCDKPGHLAKDCPNKSGKRTSIKPNSALPQSGLPSLNPPLQLKKSNVASRFYLQSEFIDSITDSETSTNLHIPLKAFKCDVNSFSVVPLSMNFGDQTVIVPMLVGSNEVIEKKLNALLKNGLNNNVCTFPIEPFKQNNEPVRQMEEFQANPHPHAIRKQTPIKNTVQNMPLNRQMTPQQQMFQANMYQGNMQPRHTFDQSVRMLGQYNSPRYQGFDPYNNYSNYPNYMPNYQMENNRRMMQAPSNTNNFNQRAYRN